MRDAQDFLTVALRRGSGKQVPTRQDRQSRQMAEGAGAGGSELCAMGLLQFPEGNSMDHERFSKVLRILMRQDETQRMLNHFLSFGQSGWREREWAGSQGGEREGEGRSYNRTNASTTRTAPMERHGTARAAAS